MPDPEERARRITGAGRHGCGHRISSEAGSAAFREPPEASGRHRGRGRHEADADPEVSDANEVAEPEEPPQTRRAALEAEEERARASTDSSKAAPATREESWRRMRSALSFSPSRSHLLVGFLCLLLAFATTTQIRQTEDDGLQQLSEPELVRILGDVNARTERLEAERLDLREQQRELESGTGQQEAAREQAERRAEALAILAGEVPVAGPGVTLMIDDPAGGVTAADLVGLVQELRDAGAESIEISGIRVIASTAITQRTDGIAVGGQAISAPHHVIAIGDPSTMETAMNIPGGVNDTVQRRGASMAVTQEDQVDIDSVVEN